MTRKRKQPVRIGAEPFDYNQMIDQCSDVRSRCLDLAESSVIAVRMLDQIIRAVASGRRIDVAYAHAAVLRLEKDINKTIGGVTVELTKLDVMVTEAVMHQNAEAEARAERRPKVTTPPPSGERPIQVSTSSAPLLGREAA